MAGFASIQLELYRRMCRVVEAAHGKLFSTVERNIPSEFVEWSVAWANAFLYRKALQLPPKDLVETGRLLARVAESYTAHAIAEDVFKCIETLVEESNPGGLDLAEMLVGAGEIDRRRARPDVASKRCERAFEIAKTQDTAPAHKLASRILYELAFIDLYRGNAGSALQRLAISQAEADKAEDAVGAGIARALSAAVRIEEGFLDDPTMTLRAEAMSFAALAESDEIKRIGRHMFANRWRVNCDIHHAQALLASGEVKAARDAYDTCVANNPNTSALGNATLALTGACIALAEGRFDDAAKLTEACRNATPPPFEDQEAAASITSIYGVISLARGDVARARDAFNEATMLNPALRNAKGQGWAALGLAILAIDAGDRTAALAALDVGINRCANCCTPLRRALTEMRAEIATGPPHSERDWKAVLRALTGPLPKWLATH